MFLVIKQVQKKISLDIKITKVLYMSKCISNALRGNRMFISYRKILH